MTTNHESRYSIYKKFTHPVNISGLVFTLNPVTAAKSPAWSTSLYAAPYKKIKTDNTSISLSITLVKSKHLGDLRHCIWGVHVARGVNVVWGTHCHARKCDHLSGHTAVLKQKISSMFASQKLLYLHSALYNQNLRFLYDTETTFQTIKLSLVKDHQHSLILNDILLLTSLSVVAKELPKQTSRIAHSP